MIISGSVTGLELEFPLGVKGTHPKARFFQLGASQVVVKNHIVHHFYLSPLWLMGYIDTLCFIYVSSCIDTWIHWLALWNNELDSQECNIIFPLWVMAYMDGLLITYHRPINVHTNDSVLDNYIWLVNHFLRSLWHLWLYCNIGYHSSPTIYLNGLLPAWFSHECQYESLTTWCMLLSQCTIRN